MQPPTIQCPLCGKDDQIRKISSIVAAGISTTTLSGTMSGVAVGRDGISPVSGSSTMSGETSTILAKRLSPPPKPGVVGIFFWVSMVFVVVWGLNAGTLWPGLLLAAVFAASSYGYWETLKYLVIAIFGVPLLLAAGWGPAYFARKYYLRKKAEYLTKLPIWEAGMERWNTLYYCFRDDIIFDPSTGETLGDSIYNSGIFDY